jgi:hypothetical protein
LEVDSFARTISLEILDGRSSSVMPPGGAISQAIQPLSGAP